uniref:DUF1279 domain-containing protein n=1 Tax=Kalanchoe fedtschenkoi TaxID=63787 RepID=A0A7N0U542_KALFE
MAWLAAKGRFREFIGKYGKVAVGVHCSVSFASIAGLYVAIKNNVDVESVLEKIGVVTSSPEDETQQIPSPVTPPSEVVLDDFVTGERGRVTDGGVKPEKKRNKTAEIAASSGGALAAAVLLNKALFPVRVPITIALTPPIARMLARRSVMKNRR